MGLNVRRIKNNRSKKTVVVSVQRLTTLIENKKRDTTRDQESAGTFVFLFRIAPEYWPASPFRYCRTLLSNCMHRHQTAGGTDRLSLLAGVREDSPAWCATWNHATVKTCTAQIGQLLRSASLGGSDGHDIFFADVWGKKPLAGAEVPWESTAYPDGESWQPFSASGSAKVKLLAEIGEADCSEAAGSFDAVCGER